MRPGIALRPDYDAARLRGLAKATRVKAGGCWRWRRSTTVAPGPKRRGSAAVGLQTLRDWVVRFNAHGPDRLIANRRDAADIARGPLSSIQVQLIFSLKCRSSVKMRVALPNIQAQITKNERDAATCSYNLAL